MAHTLHDLELICQKPLWREQGSLLARRFARPAALYITWLLSSWPVSANLVTGCTLMVGWIAAAFVAVPGYFAIGVALLWLWYLFDHVDGQLARLRGSESVTGIYFDFMMHHLVHPAVVFAIGYGLACSTNCLPWALAGAGFAFGTIALSITNDCRYKAFFAGASRAIQATHPVTDEAISLLNIESLRTDLRSNGSRNWRELSLRGLFRFLKMIHSTLVRLCEVPNIILVLTLLAACSFLDATVGLAGVQAYTLLMAILAPLLAVLRLIKQVWNRIPDHDFRRTPLGAR